MRNCYYDMTLIKLCVQSCFAERKKHLFPIVFALNLSFVDMNTNRKSQKCRLKPSNTGSKHSNVNVNVNSLCN